MPPIIVAKNIDIVDLPQKWAISKIANTDYEIQNSDLEIPEQASTKIVNTVYQIRNLLTRSFST